MGIFYYWIDFVINLMEVCIHKGLKVSSELKEVVLFCNEFVQYQKITPKKGLNFEELLNQQSPLKRKSYWEFQFLKKQERILIFIV